MTAILSTISAIGSAISGIFKWLFVRDIRKQAEQRYEAERRAANSEALRLSTLKSTGLTEAYNQVYREYEQKEKEDEKDNTNYDIID